MEMETEMEKETEYRICKRRFQLTVLKKNYISNNNILLGREYCCVQLILVKRLLIPLPAMNTNTQGTVKREEKL